MAASAFLVMRFRRAGLVASPPFVSGAARFLPLPRPPPFCPFPEAPLPDVDAAASTSAPSSLHEFLHETQKKPSLQREKLHTVMGWQPADRYKKGLSGI